MELISDKKGCDKSIFDTIRSDLDKLRQSCAIDSVGDGLQYHPQKRRPAMCNPVGQENGSDSKRPRI